MPYKDSSKQREYVRKWVADRRAAWFSDKYCVQCGNAEDLEIDHIVPETKERKIDHNIWSWSQEKRDAELQKCQVLCHDCHQEKSSAENSARQSATPITHGSYWGYRRGCRCYLCSFAGKLYRAGIRRSVKDSGGQIVPSLFPDMP